MKSSMRKQRAADLSNTTSSAMPQPFMNINLFSRSFRPTLCLLVGALFFAHNLHPVMAQSTTFKLIPNNIHDATLREVDGGYEIQTTGGDPYVFTAPTQGKVGPAQHYLSFEFFSTTGTDAFQVFLMPPLSEANSIKGKGLVHSEGWSSYAIDVAEPLGKVPNPQQLRLDFGNQKGKTIRLRNLQLREPTKQETELAARRDAARDAEKQREIHLRYYLNSMPLSSFGVIKNVTADEKNIKIEGFYRFSTLAEGKWNLFLAEVPIFENVTEVKQFPWVAPLNYVGLPELDGVKNFSHTVERMRVSNGNTYDRLLSRWAIVKKVGDQYQLLSHGSYATEVKPRADLPQEKPRNKKGLGGFNLGYPVSDLDDLGISYVTVNIVLNGLMATAPRADFSPTQFAGKTYYVNDKAIEGFDKTFQETAKRHIVVSAIILIGKAGNAPSGSFSKLITYPDADPSGIFAMPNVASEEGVEAYAAILNYLAERYSRPDGKYGRIHHWIMHNEVNAGWVWTNAGEKTPLLYMDLYHKSMRIAHLIARQYDTHAQAFISLEHHWLSPNSQIYGGRDLLDLLLDFSHAEGDFDWSLAYHPYPQNLMEPRVWEDNQVKFAFDTPKITFKNLEVLDAWMKQPRYLFNGKVRAVHLTEQGLNSPDYSEKSLQDQAAGMAYTWQKVKRLDSIQAFDYHNWVDNRGEGGLRIGLRRFPDDENEPLGKKPIWFVYQALDTPNEEAAIAFAKPITGVQNWNDVLHREVIAP